MGRFNSCVKNQTQKHCRPSEAGDTQQLLSSCVMHAVGVWLVFEGSRVDWISLGASHWKTFQTNEL